MTWKEFKDKVEAEGVKDDMEIWYIDTSFPSEERLVISPEDEQDGIAIYS